MRCSSCATPIRRCSTACKAELHTLVEEANQSGRCKLELRVISQSTPAKMDERLMSALDTAAEHTRRGKLDPHAERRRPRCADGSRARCRPP